MTFSSLTVCADMHGCPNRCRHCWLGHARGGHMTETDLAEIAAAFRPYTSSLEIDTWYREPDYPDNYRTLWDLRTALSDRVTPHYELASVWRAVRDPSYIPWLAERGVTTVQLTLFGGEEITDRFTGRCGAYRDILRTVDLLLAQEILPRIQVFVYKENIEALSQVDALIDTLALPERCGKAGGEMQLFLHQGSCEGAAAALYESWITPAELSRIPERLARHTCRYFGKPSLRAVFGETEAHWVRQLADAPVQEGPVSDSPVFFVDHRLDVYPNLSAPTPYWRLGNLQTDGAAAIVANYRQNHSIAQHAMTHVPLGKMVRAVGDPDSERLFTRGDYAAWILNRYCEREIDYDP